MCPPKDDRRPSVGVHSSFSASLGIWLAVRDDIVHGHIPLGHSVMSLRRASGNLIGHCCPMVPGDRNGSQLRAEVAMKDF